MRILIAGGAGFVGSHLAERLIELGHRVVVVDNLITGRRENLAALLERERASIEFVAADVSRPFTVDGTLDIVFHLASPASPKDYLRHPLETLEAGSQGTRHLLELARGHQARFLLASTSEVYGDPEVHPQPESYWGRVNPVGPRSVYDEAKRYAEALTAAYGRHAGVTVRIARIFNTYGPRMRFDDGRVIPSFVTQALTAAPITVHGDGSQTRSYCYVDDLVEGLIRLAVSGVDGPVNLGNPEEYSVLDTARRVLALTGSPSPIVYRPLPEDDPRLRRPDIRRATATLGWTPRTRFDDGLARTVADLEARLRRGEPDVQEQRRAIREAPGGDGAWPAALPSRSRRLASGGGMGAPPPGC